MPAQDAYHQTLARNLPRVRARMAAAAERAGRPADATRIVAVTKGHPAAAVEAALAAGLRDLGENRVEELLEKAPLFAERPVAWHVIGHVQSRKARGAARLAALVHSVDSLRLARKLSLRAEAEGRRLPVLVQVNASGEAAKGGFPAAAGAAQAADAVAAVAANPGLCVTGVMTMAPFVADEAVLRATFARTREVIEAAQGADGVEGAELSMGMSNDFEIAIEEGSTMVRLGTTLFGPRAGAGRG